LGADLKRLLHFLVFCAAISGLIVTPTAFGQPSASVPAGEQVLVGQAKGGGHFSVDYSFKGAGAKDGAVPTATLIQDAAGNLYGTTSSGGGTGCGGSGCGVVFKLNTANHETVLHAFSGPDGAIPYGALVMDIAGNLYGTTSSGGASGLGTVFKIDTTGKETVLYTFTGNPDGANPYAGLVMDSSGNLYGTTESGGVSNLGTIFQIDRNGAETVLHSFAGQPSDGADPKAGLTLDSNGILYGTTFSGGSAGFGTAYQLDTTNSESVLYNFTGQADGGNPFGGLTLDSNGTLYGTTTIGGSSSGKGVLGGGPSGDRPYGCCKGIVYELSGGEQTILYTFTGGNDGGTPSSTLVLSNGLLYGTTLAGGPGNDGTAFSVTIANHAESILHGFKGGSDGASPGAGLLLNSAGVLYGTTQGGGHFQKGTVFQYKQ
jgi:uncharacterized repeat protein (TIGR03803 family)